MKNEQIQKHSRGDRTPDVELERRIRQVTGLIIAGVCASDIEDYCGEKWKVSPRTAQRYIKDASEQFRLDSARDRQIEVGIALERFQSLFCHARKSGDFKGAASIQDRICRLLGLWDETPTVKIEAGDALTEFLRQIRANQP